MLENYKEGKLVEKSGKGKKEIADIANDISIKKIIYHKTSWNKKIIHKIEVVDMELIMIRVISKKIKKLDYYIIIDIYYYCYYLIN